MGGFLPKLQFLIILPPALVFLVLASASTYLVANRRLTTINLLETAMPWALRLTFLLYPLVCEVAFEAWSCYDFPETDKSYLRVDVAVECHTAQHDEILGWAITAVVLYVAGIWLACAMLIAQAYHSIRTTPTRFARSISFLYHEYKPESCWWELVEMLRRALLVGLLRLVPPHPGSILQIAIATLVSVAYIVIQQQAAPYKSLSDGWVAMASSVAMLVLFVWAIISKYSELADTTYEIISPEQRRTFGIRFEAEICFIAAAGIIIFTFLLLLGQIREEHKNLQYKARVALARRLRYQKDGTEVLAPKLARGQAFHMFLSHVWGTGQDQMRVIKTRLLEMVPDLRVFLDVDDLKKLNDLEKYVDSTNVILVFCSDGYFASKNCMRELLRATWGAKPIIALMEPEARRGGLSRQEVCDLIHDAEATLFDQWALGSAVSTWGVGAGGIVHADTICNALFSQAHLEWNRLGSFQDVTMRVIAERLLPASTGPTFVQGELGRQAMLLPPPLQGETDSFHLYCSLANPGGLSFTAEYAAAQRLQLQWSTSDQSQTRPPVVEEASRLWHRLVQGKLHGGSRTLRVTTLAEDMKQCDHFLVYLNAATWSRGAASEAFAAEVGEAMDLNVHLLLCHEMIGPGQEARLGCEFQDFFSHPDGATPRELIQREIYKEIACPLKCGAHREVSMVIVTQVIASVHAGRSKPTLIRARSSSATFQVYGRLRSRSRERSDSAGSRQFASAFRRASLFAALFRGHSEFADDTLPTYPSMQSVDAASPAPDTATSQSHEMPDASNDKEDELKMTTCYDGAAITGVKPKRLSLDDHVGGPITSEVLESLSSKANDAEIGEIVSEGGVEVMRI